MEHPQTHSVTTMVRRRVRAGQEAGYEAWLTELLRDADALPGYLGTDVRRPAAPDRTYVSIFRFDTLANLEVFENSNMRREHLARVTPFVEGDAVWGKMSGLEVWFDAPKGAAALQPTRWKMAVLLTGLVFVLVEILGAFVRLAAPDLSPRLALLVIVTAQVCLLTYVIMPPLTRRLAFWLFPSPPQPKD